MVENLEDLREEFLKNGGHEITDAITVIKFMLSKGFSRRPELDEKTVFNAIHNLLDDEPGHPHNYHDSCNCDDCVKSAN